MELNEFIENFAEQFDDTDASEIKADTVFKELDEWSSLVALSVIAMVDEEYDITIKGESIIHKTTRQITEMSVGHIPEDRHRDGMVLEMTVAENIALQTYYKEPNSKNGILNYSVINAKARELMKEFEFVKEMIIKLNKELKEEEEDEFE